MRLRRWIEKGLLIGGLIAVDIWIWSQAGSAVYQNWASWTFERELHHEPAKVTDFLSARKDDVVHAIDEFFGIKPGEKQAPQVAHVPPRRMVPHRIPRNGVIGRLSIPRLKMTGMVREGAGEDTLSLALGHIPGTALPGESGNIGIAGHRDELFRGLRNIRANDLIVLETLGGNFVYKVESTSIVKPSDTAVLRTGPGAELTLVTCYPFYYVGSAPDRFIVKARQVPGNVAAAAKSVG